MDRTSEEIEWETVVYPYSFFNESTGLDNAARRVCTLIVSSAMPERISKGHNNNSIDKSILYGNCFSHSSTPSQTKGSAIRLEIISGFKNCLVNKSKIEFTDAPKTLRMLISFKRCRVVKEASPQRPKHPINTASAENALNSFPNCSSDWYCWL